MLGTSIGVRGLNPFGTGQCLTTKELKMAKVINLSLNPFGTGQCLTTNFNALTKKRNTSQSLWNRAVSYDGTTRMIAPMIGSQSLWNRAVSYDLNARTFLLSIRLNPFGTGQCLTTENDEPVGVTFAGLNPFGTGQCLTTEIKYRSRVALASLNPFGTGQCLTTSPNQLDLSR